MRSECIHRRGKEKHKHRKHIEFIENPFPSNIYPAHVKRVIDGDTFKACVDLGFRVRLITRIRLARVNAPEIRTKNLEEKSRGLEAKDYLEQLLFTHNNKVYIMPKKKGKYGRWICEVYLPNGENLNDLLVKYGYCKEVG